MPNVEEGRIPFQNQLHFFASLTAAVRTVCVIIRGQQWVSTWNKNYLRMWKHSVLWKEVNEDASEEVFVIEWDAEESAGPWRAAAGVCVFLVCVNRQVEEGAWLVNYLLQVGLCYVLLLRSFFPCCRPKIIHLCWWVESLRGHQPVTTSLESPEVFLRVLFLPPRRVWFFLKWAHPAAGESIITQTIIGRLFHIVSTCSPLDLSLFSGLWGCVELLFVSWAVFIRVKTSFKGHLNRNSAFVVFSTKHVA